MTDVRATASGLPPYPVRPSLDVMEAARATWRVFTVQPWSLIGLLFLFPFLIALPLSIVQGVVGAVAGDNQALVIPVAILAFIVQLAGQFTCQLGVLWGAGEIMEGRRFTIGEAMRAGFGQVLSYLGLAILIGLILVVGLLLLVIPGIIAMGFLAVAAPACAIERLGPIESIQRSIALVRGNWWRSFGTFLLVVFGPLLAFAAACLILYGVFAALGVKALAFILVLPAVPFVIVLAAVGAVVPSVLFMELRALKEGRRGTGAAWR